METKKQKIIYVNACGPQKGLEAVPGLYSMRLKSNCSITDLKNAVAQAVGTRSKACCIMIALVEYSKLSRVYAASSLIRKFKSKDEIWAYELPKLIENSPDGKTQKRENWISVQVQHTIHGVVGKPFIIVVPESKLKVMPVGELRQIMREAMAPFLKGGWQCKEEDADLYSISLMNKACTEFIMTMPLDAAATVDLTTQTEKNGFSFRLNWSRSAFDLRYWNGVPKKIIVPFFTGLSQHMGQLLERGDHSDVVLVINGTEIPAHKAILSARSPYFKAMFIHKMTESLESVVRIDDISLPAFRQLLQFIYTDHCDFNTSLTVANSKDKDAKDEKDDKDAKAHDVHTATMMLAIADRFQVPELAELCSEHLSANITVATAAELLIMADAMHATHLKQQIMDFICKDDKRRAEVMDTDMFQTLSPALLHEILISVTPAAQKASKKRARQEDHALIKADVKKLKVSELRAELESRGLETGGMKVDLIDRLENALTV